MMAPKILLINPPIYDFSAYNFWSKPYGLLTVGGFLQNDAELAFFDYLDDPKDIIPINKRLRRDCWDRGEFYSQLIPKPSALASIPRRYHRFGLPRSVFQSLLSDESPFDFALIQTGMTYWYPAVKEVIEDIRLICPDAKIILGGIYATICPEHAAGLGSDLVVKGAQLENLWKYLNITPSLDKLPVWQFYRTLKTGALKITDGCPFKCSYCAAPLNYKEFKPRPLEQVIAEFEFLLQCGASNVAFYDDALLFEAENILVPFLHHVIDTGVKINFHTPNALHATFLTPDLAELMMTAGFKTFYIGLESSRNDWHKKTGGKVRADEFSAAVKTLLAAGAGPQNITAYIIAGHPNSKISEIEETMRFANDLGIRIMLAEFSPIPGTADGRLCERTVDMDEPLWHNKTAFPIAFLGNDAINHLKELCRGLNKSLSKSMNIE